MSRYVRALQSWLSGRVLTPALPPKPAPPTPASTPVVLQRPLIRTQRPPIRRYANGMQRSNHSLVWIDCEMTGLDARNDQILEIACYVTDGSLAHLDSEGLHRVIRTEPTRLATMNKWCRAVHGKSGLTAKCLSDEAVSAEQAAQDVMAYIRRYVKHPNTALIAGNSIHADQRFLAVEPWAGILEMLHYRIFDVTSLKEAVARWAPEEVLRCAPRKELKHTAKEDILESIREAKYYKEMVFGRKGWLGGKKGDGEGEG